MRTKPPRLGKLLLKTVQRVFAMEGRVELPGPDFMSFLLCYFNSSLLPAYP